MHNINFIKLLKNMSIHLKFKILDYFVYFIQYTYNVFTKVSMTPVSHCLVNESTSNETFHGNTFVILLPVGIMLRVLKCSAQIRITSVRTIHGVVRTFWPTTFQNLTGWHEQFLRESAVENERESSESYSPYY